MFQVVMEQRTVTSVGGFGKKWSFLSRRNNWNLKNHEGRKFRWAYQKSTVAPRKVRKDIEHGEKEEALVPVESIGAVSIFEEHLSRVCPAVYYHTLSTLNCSSRRPLTLQRSLLFKSDPCC
jgi:hypothetical protein